MFVVPNHFGMFKFYRSWYIQPMFEWKIEYLAEENMLSIKTKGQMDVPSANAMVKAIADAASEHHCYVHLIDHREMNFAFSLTDYYDRPSINEKLGVSRKFKTAMVFSQLTEDTEFMETVFRNRGYNLCHFTDIGKAREWLKDKAP